MVYGSPQTLMLVCSGLWWSMIVQGSPWLSMADCSGPWESLESTVIYDGPWLAVQVHGGLWWFLHCTKGTAVPTSPGELMPMIFPSCFPSRPKLMIV